MTIALTGSLTARIVSALNQNKVADELAMIVAIVGISVPTFVSRPVLGDHRCRPIVIPAHRRLVPVRVPDVPSIVLAFEPAVPFARDTRPSMPAVIRKDAIRTALIPARTGGDVLLGVVFTDSFVVETIAAAPGVGGSFVTSVADDLLVGCMPCAAGRAKLGHSLLGRDGVRGDNNAPLAAVTCGRDRHCCVVLGERIRRIVGSVTGLSIRAGLLLPGLVADRIAESRWLG
ncbi:MAG: hypothetical protein KatS3mg060_3570 [Dehalococcoidia bacterium]|nr:MAG: hypothetical protein KatS3mg060_3570 [Dehalococcoidia bacterium]